MIFAEGKKNVNDLTVNVTGTGSLKEATIHYPQLLF
jgi:hypothetical protein